MNPNKRDEELAKAFSYWIDAYDLDSRELSTLAKYFALAREEGRQQGLEDAAVECEICGDFRYNGDWFSSDIRALKEKKP
jgi:hypothetical protein